MGIRIGDLSSIYNGLGSQYLRFNVNTTDFASYALPFGLIIDPQALVFKRLSTTDPTHQGNPLLPIVVYRQQAANAAFPRVSGNVTQVTPLIESVPWEYSPAPFGTHLSPKVVVPDRLIAFGMEFDPLSGNILQNSMFVRDQQPVILGARYHYYVVRMNGQREVAEVIDAGTVDIPSN